MFCQKCGVKAIEGASFCQKCGTKLVTDEEIQSVPEPMTEPVPKPAETPTQPVELVSQPIETPPLPEQMPEQTLPPKDVDQQAEDPADIHNDNNASGNDTDTYGNIGMCSAIKSVKRTKKGTRLYGKTYRYTVKPDKTDAARVKIRSVLSFPLSILYWMLAGALIFTLGLILQELIKYRDGICLEYYHYALFALCCLVAGAIILIHSFVGQKEKMAVRDYFCGIEQISLFEKKRSAIFMVRTAIAAALVVTGIIVLIFNFPTPLKYPNELLFDGAPMERFLDMTKEDIEAEFGKEEPKYQNAVTGDDVYSYSSDDGRIWCVVYSKKTGKVIYIQFGAEDCSYNRKSLSKPWYRVDDILQEQSSSADKGCSYGPDLYTSTVYGSIHTGFQYNDGVYFGDTLDVQEFIAQQEFADDYNGRFANVRVYEKGVEERGLIPLELKDYKISLMCYLLGDKLDVGRVSLYSDEWVEAMNASSSDAASSVDTPAGGTIRFDTEFYSLEFPEYWADLCVYSQWDIDPDSYAKSYGITFYEKQSSDDGYGGELFSLALYRDYVDEYYDFPDYLYLGQLDVIRLAGYDVVATFPTDVQFSEAGQENYLRLREDIYDILASFTPQSDPECEYTPAA